MNMLTHYVPRLIDLRAEFASLFTEWQQASKKLSQALAEAATTGANIQPDMDEFQSVDNRFKQLKLVAYDLVSEARQSFVQQAQNARNEGVAYPLHVVEEAFPDSAEECGNKLGQFINNVIDGIETLEEAIREYEESRIAREVEELNGTFAQLLEEIEGRIDFLKTVIFYPSTNLTAIAIELKNRFPVSGKIEDLAQQISDGQAFLEIIYKLTENALASELFICYEKLQMSWLQLQHLEPASPESLTEFDLISERITKNPEFRYGDVDTALAELERFAKRRGLEEIERGFPDVSDDWHEADEAVATLPKPLTSQANNIQSEQDFLPLFQLLNEALDDLDIYRLKDNTQPSTHDFHLYFIDEQDRLLQQLRRLLEIISKRIELARSAIEQEIDQLLLTANEVLASLHPRMPEAAQLRGIMNQRNHIEESTLLEFRSTLEDQIHNVDQAGENAINRYRERSKTKDYMLNDIEEAREIGTALGLIADRSEYYTGPLWHIGFDVLSNLNQEYSSQEFFDEFGYTIIERALEAGIREELFPETLSFISIGFLPPNPSGNQLEDVFSHPRIQAVFERANKLRLLRISPIRFKTFDKSTNEVLVVLLQHADMLGIPPKVRLQYTALLRQVVDPENILYQKINHLFLMFLLNAGHYSAWFYTLEELNRTRQNIQLDRYLPIGLPPVIGLALNSPESNALFLRLIWDKYANIEWDKSENFENRFLMAALGHYLCHKLGFSDLYLSVWQAWDKLKDDFPKLSELLIRNLDGEEFGDIAAIDANTLKRNLREKISEVRLLINSEKLPRFKGFPLAKLIHNWYAENHIEPWLKRLEASNVSEKDIRDIIIQVEEKRNEDLVEECPLQQDPPITGDRPMNRIKYDLKVSLNRRLYGIIDQVKEMAVIQQQLLRHRKSGNLPFKQIQAEVQEISERSKTSAWVLEQLVAQELPFLKDSLAALELDANRGDG